MRTCLLAIGLFFFGIITYPQEKCKDIIYTVEGGNIIFDCCVKEVKSGNIVYYMKAGDTASVAATAIIKDGQRLELGIQPSSHVQQNTISMPDTLYRGQNMAYYQYLYNRARGQRGTGICFTFFGILSELVGLIISADDSNKGTGFFVAGAVMETIGIPLWISGGIKMANNRKAIEEINNKKSLTFGPTQSGIGLTFNF